MPTASATTSAAEALALGLGAAATTDEESRVARAVGGVVPPLVARPADADELRAIVAAAAACHAALVPLGHGTHRGLGHPPARYDLALVTDRLTRVREYTPADMTVEVEVGTTLAALGDLLAREGQWLPLEPPHPAATTVGGLVAADLAGPLAASQGRVRDYVIGIGVVTAAGVAARAGGRVVKNVAGYDLMKLFVGSFGTLAVVTDVTFKVRPRPETERVLVFAGRAIEEALRFGVAAGSVDPGVVAVSVGGGVTASRAGSTVLVRLGGTTADVAAAATRLAAEARRGGWALAGDDPLASPAGAARWAAIRDFSATAAGELVLRLAGLPTRLPALVAAADALPDAAWQADPLRGVLVLSLAGDDAGSSLAALTRAADAAGARLVVERWPLALASSITVWHPLPAALPLMRRLKGALDPHGILAPGRFVGRL